jgi:hypothetical protein
LLNFHLVRFSFLWSPLKYFLLWISRTMIGTRIGTLNPGFSLSPFLEITLVHLLSPATCWHILLLPICSVSLLVSPSLFLPAGSPCLSTQFLRVLEALPGFPNFAVIGINPVNMILLHLQWCASLPEVSTPSLHSRDFKILDVPQMILALDPQISLRAELPFVLATMGPGNI